METLKKIANAALSAVARVIDVANLVFDRVWKVVVPARVNRAIDRFVERYC